MITNLKTTIWAIALLFSVASVMVLSSCSEDDPPPPDPIIAPGVSYAATTVAVGSEGSIAAAVTGDAATYEITDDGDADFVTVNATTGELSVAAESTTGAYSVVVKATNSAGSSDGTAEITIGINEAFDPTGKGYLWQYFMNQDEPWTLSGLDGEVADQPFPSIDIPTGWPADWPTGNADWANPTYLPQYLALGLIADLLFQVPGDIACEALDPEEGGDTLYFGVDDDLSLTTICHIGDDPGQSVLIGTSTISYADGEFSWALNLESQIPITYIIDNPTAEEFVDPLDSFTEQGAPVPRVYPAIRGMVEEFTTPTNVFDEAAILTSLALKKVEVVLEVIDL